MKIDLIGNNSESEILYQNDELVIFEQENIKWIVTKNNEILMSVKDIGLLGGNEDKTKRYERDLRNKEFIIPYKGKTIKCIYEQNLFRLLKDDPRGRDPTLYNYPAITQIIAELRTDQARKRNRKLGLLQEEIRTKGFFIAEGREQEALTHLKKLRSKSTNVQKILNGLFTLAKDYAPSDPKIGEFYGTMQNKLYQAVTDLTAKELIYHRADHTKPHMGLITWKGKRDVTKSDVKIGKNYLKKWELDLLIKIINMMVDVIEIKILMKKDFKMDYVIRIFNHHLVLVAEKEVTGHGKIGKNIAEKHALKELDKYRNLLINNKGLITC